MGRNGTLHVQVYETAVELCTQCALMIEHGGIKKRFATAPQSHLNDAS